MKGPILSLLVFYKEQQITKPVDFVMDFCDMWNTADYEPLKLYKGTAPIAFITRELLQEILTFSEKDKPGKLKSLMLKTSLKRSRVEVHFRFEHPDMKRIADFDYLGWQKTASSIGINIPFDNVKSNGNYTFDTLFQIFFWLLSYGTVENASVALVSDIEFTTNVHEKIFAVISENKGVIRKRRLDWATFFTAYEYQNILEASVVCVGSSTARESRMKFRAGEHDHSYHIVHIAEAKGSADDEFDLVVSRLGASIRQLEPCGGNDGREVTLDFPA